MQLSSEYMCTLCRALHIKEAAIFILFLLLVISRNSILFSITVLKHMQKIKVQNTS
jgi:hypothetical protein